MQAVPSSQPRVAGIETRRGNEILQVVASAAGVSVAELVNGNGGCRLTLYRNLAIFLCGRVYGIQDSRLAGIFGVSAGSLKVLRSQLVARLEYDIPLRRKFDRICSALCEEPVGPYSAWRWPEGRVREIWDHVSASAGYPYTGAEFMHLRYGSSASIAPYRWLAMDMCLRLSGMNLHRLANGLGLPYKSVQYAAKQLPGKLAADEDLRRVDREVSSALGLPPREEWYA